MAGSLLQPDLTHALIGKCSVEISVRGKWTRVPALDVSGNKLIVYGKRLKRAVVQDEEWLDSEVNDPELCVQALEGQTSGDLRADIFTFSQMPPNTDPKYPYPFERDSVAVASISSFKDWWEGLPQVTRKNVRRSQKRGVMVRVCQLDDELIKGLVDLNNDSPVRQGRRYSHYGKSFDQVRKDQSSFLDRCDFIGAYFGNELVGFLKLVYRGQTASILQLLPKASHADKRPANALVAKAVEICDAKGITHLTYGLYNYGNKGDNPLREFKIRNGFSELLVPRYYVPLTLKGRLCMKLKLHRGLVGVLPQRIISLGVAARSHWYHFKHSFSRRSLIVERPGL
ncbi:MAG: hypothetical protein EPN47_03510 [Acidobacteria bacterium]|nr:MAG: hypothetical protein EPN47_03510 [Acidobacteriota bacterium]